MVNLPSEFYISVKFESNHNNLRSRKLISKCRLPNDCQFVSVSMLKLVVPSTIRGDWSLKKYKGLHNNCLICSRSMTWTTHVITIRSKSDRRRVASGIFAPIASALGDPLHKLHLRILLKLPNLYEICGDTNYDINTQIRFAVIIISIAMPCQVTNLNMWRKLSCCNAVESQLFI